MPLFSLTTYWHWSLKELTNQCHKSTEFTYFDSSLLKEKILSKDHNGESNQWHEWPAIVKSNLKSISVFPRSFVAIGFQVRVRYSVGFKIEVSSVI